MSLTLKSENPVTFILFINGKLKLNVVLLEITK